jgi:hypothetical protein
MARIRSPNYPAISLAEALKRIEQVHERERQHPASREVIMKGMGFGGVNGASLGAISAANKYGLLEKSGKGEDYRVSDRAVAILHPHTAEEKVQALHAAAHAPVLFNELLEHFKGGLPSDDNLRAYLVRRGFSQSSLPGVIQSFRDTMELVSPNGPGYGDRVASANQMVGLVSSAPALQAGERASASAAPTKADRGKPGMSESAISIKDDCVELSALLFDQEAVQKIIDRLTAVKSLLPERVVGVDQDKEPG